MVLVDEGELLEMVPQDWNLKKTVRILPTDNKETQSDKIPYHPANPAELNRAFLVSAISDRQIWVLTNGAVFTKDPATRRSVYNVEGVAHLLINGDESTSVLNVTLNGISMQINHAHLFINGMYEPVQWSVAEGEVFIEDVDQYLSPEDVRRLEQDARLMPGETTLRIKKGESLQFVQEKMMLGPQVNLVTDSVYKNASIPGFEAPGPYVSAGFVEADPVNLKINRNSQVSILPGNRIPVFEGDVITTVPGQTAILSLISSDQIMIGENSQFSLQELQLDSKNNSGFLAKINPFGSQKQYRVLGSLLGKMRAIISPRGRPGMVKVKTPTATIGVKGTDFEVTGTDAESEVLTVEGLVSVADSQGLGEVDVEPGMMTTVKPGQEPAKPTPIPLDRLKLLNPELFRELHGPDETTPEAPEIKTGKSVEVKARLPQAFIAPITFVGIFSYEEKKLLAETFAGELARHYEIMKPSHFWSAHRVANKTLDRSVCVTERCYRKTLEQLNISYLFRFMIVRTGTATRLNVTLLDYNRVYTSYCEFCAPEAWTALIKSLVKQITGDVTEASFTIKTTDDPSARKHKLTMVFSGIQGTLNSETSEIAAEMSATASSVSLDYLYRTPSGIVMGFWSTREQGSLRQVLESGEIAGGDPSLMYSQDVGGLSLGYSFNPGNASIIFQLVGGQGQTVFFQQSDHGDLWQLSGTTQLGGLEIPVYFDIGGLVLGFKLGGYNTITTFETQTQTSKPSEDQNTDQVVMSYAKAGLLIGFSF
ncbi:MAG: FecR domain-containing protein [SAR324 cluster bacterium]|nr:FecR domain-containing protein [SAR324 cluster bacterium]